MVARLPERDLAESILDLAAPLLELLGATPPVDEARSAIELAINLWNAQVTASKVWGVPRPKPLANLRMTMSAARAAPCNADIFKLLSERWRKEFVFDPRLVGKWSYERVESGRYHLVCETTLPEGVEAEIPPAVQKRIAIGDRFLDEVRIHQEATAYLRFPVEHHRGAVDADGVATVHTKMPTVVQLFAEGRLLPIGGPPRRRDGGRDEARPDGTDQCTVRRRLRV